VVLRPDDAAGRPGRATHPDQLRWDEKTAEFRSNAEAITGRFADIKAEHAEYLSRKAGEPESSQDSI
jgi:hypothetical protein